MNRGDFSRSIETTNKEQNSHSAHGSDWLALMLHLANHIKRIFTNNNTSRPLRRVLLDDVKIPRVSGYTRENSPARLFWVRSGVLWYQLSNGWADDSYAKNRDFRGTKQIIPSSFWHSYQNNGANPRWYTTCNNLQFVIATWHVFSQIDFG